MAHDLIFFFMLLLIFVSTISLKKIISDTTDLTAQIHYSIAAVLAILGFCSFSFVILDIQLTIKNINIYLLSVICLYIGYKSIAYSKQARSTYSCPWLCSKTVISAFISYFSAFLCGYLLFSFDLVPSSMTGDPARHLLRIKELSETGIPSATKSVHPTVGLIFSKIFSDFSVDKVFLVYNILILGFFCFSCMLLLRQIIRGLGYWWILVAAPLICFSYPFFALIFGYYTLLLGAALLFSTLALVAEQQNRPQKVNYFPIFLLSLGVIFSHNYLFPVCILSISFFSMWVAITQRNNKYGELLRATPFILALIVISFVSNKLGGYNSFKNYHDHLSLQGYVNESFLLNIVPLVPFALIFMLREFENKSTQVLIIFVASSLAFSLFMGTLYFFGVAAPYYVNRNQIVVVPLLIIANLGFIFSLSKSHFKTAFALLSLVLAIFFTPFALPSTDAFVSIPGNYRRLLQGDRFVYFENALITRSSPLQMSSNDRNLMLRIGRNESECIVDVPRQMAVLGTDHEVNWFYIYTHIYPSLFHRDDGFIDFANYERNFRLWKTDPRQKYLVVLRHFDYWRKDSILNEIRSLSELACQGDSILIYRKQNT